MERSEEMKPFDFFKKVYKKENDSTEHVAIKKIDFSALKKENFKLNIEVGLPELKKLSEPDGFFYDGHAVIVYQKTRFQKDYTYHYHICWCDTLEEVAENGKLDKYVVSTDITDELEMRNSETGEIETSKLEVCLGCLKKLNWRNIAYQPSYQRKDMRKKFDLQKFMDEKNAQSLKRDKRLSLLDRHIVEFKSFPFSNLNTYSSNWSSIARMVKNHCHWICAECGKDCTNTPEELTVHHIDENKANESLSNLQPLCKACHAKKHPNNPHYK